MFLCWICVVALKGDMSNFICDKCGVTIIDTPAGYVTSCEHYKAEDVNKLRSKYLEETINTPLDFLKVINEEFWNIL